VTGYRDATCFHRDGLGIRKDDRVSIYAINRVEYLDALFACNKLGAILHAINWRLTVRELKSIINEVASRVLLYSQEFGSQVDALRPRLPAVEYFIEGVKQRRLKDGDLMIIVAAGIGYVWGAACVKWVVCET
jgi:acyl-CoA synthetase (AMP-forming)/AMP-acid ligase II